MVFPAGTRSVNCSHNNSAGAEDFEKYVKSSQFCRRPAPAERSDDGDLEMVSLKEEVYANLESEIGIGLVGRVFLNRTPEWTKNAQNYSSKDYPQRDEAIRYNVRGSLALPVFEYSGHRCLGVLEIVMTVEKESCDCEFRECCRALELANLKSLGILSHHVNRTLRRDSAVNVKSDGAKPKKKQRTKTSEITREVLSKLSEMQRNAAAKKLGISKSTLRNKCRQLGIAKWPYKKITQGSCKLGKDTKEILQHIDQKACEPTSAAAVLDVAAMQDLSSTITTEYEYGSEITNDQYPTEVFELISLAATNVTKMDELNTTIDDKSVEKVFDKFIDDLFPIEVLEPISLAAPNATTMDEFELILLAEPDATTTGYSNILVGEDQYQTQNTDDRLSDKEWCAALLRE